MSISIRMLALAAAFVVAAPAPALAMGSDNAPAGGASSQSNASSAYDEAVAAVEAGDYEEAIEILMPLVEDERYNADALNYIGYSHRKLGNFDAARDYYLQALEIEPEHKGANEYLGELHLETGDLAAAEERLAVLERVCGTSGCAEKDELAGKIAAYKQANPTN